MHQKPKIQGLIFFDPYPQGVGAFEQKYQKPNLFMKYFPKYLKNLTIDFKHGAVKSKVERTKVIYDLKSTEHCEKSSHWRVLLSNKMKTVKTLSNNFQSTVVFLKKIKLFSGLRSIQLFPLEGHNEFEFYLRRKANKTMLGLPKLNSLNIHIWDLPKNYLYFFEDLNSLPKLLKRLKIHIVVFRAPECDLPVLIETFHDNQNILGNMHSFSIGELTTSEPHQAFQSLAGSCPNLRHLSFGFSSQENSSYRGKGSYIEKKISDSRLPVNASCLRILTTFPNLKSLDLKIGDHAAFLKHFVLPTGVCKLNLEFKEDSKFFEGSHTFLKENFKHLESMESLRLIFNEYHGPDNYEDQNELSQCILKRLPSLKSFAFVVKTSDALRMRWKYQNPIEDFSLPDLLDSCSQTLETLEIDTYEKILYSEYDFSTLEDKFPNLTTIKFKGRFSGDEPEKICSILQQLISLGKSITIIELTVIFGYEELFLGLFNELEKVQIPSQLKIKMKIQPTTEPYGYHYYEWPEEEEESNDQKSYPKFPGISLAIFTFNQSWDMTGFLDSFADSFDSFKIICESRGLDLWEGRI